MLPPLVAQHAQGMMELYLQYLHTVVQQGDDSLPLFDIALDTPRFVPYATHVFDFIA